MKIIVEIPNDEENNKIEDTDENISSFSEYLQQRIIYICNEYNIEAKITEEINE